MDCAAQTMDPCFALTSRGIAQSRNCATHVDGCISLVQAWWKLYIWNLGAGFDTECMQLHDNFALAFQILLELFIV